MVLASRSATDRPSTTPITTSPRTMMVNSPKRSTSESVGVRPRLARDLRAASAMPTIQATPRPAHTTSPGGGGGGEACAGQDARRRHAHADHIARRGRQELGVVPTVLTPDGVPEPGLD